MSEKKRWEWLQSPRTLLRTILELNDSPHSIALGTAIGMFIGLTPTVGIQMAMVMVVALLTKRFFHFNRVAALITVYISNPLTMVPIYYALYWVGTFFVAGHATREQFTQILEYNSFAEWWETIVALFVGIGAPLLVGTAIVATVGGLVTYPLMLTLLHRFRSHRSEVSEGKMEAKPEIQTEEEQEKLPSDTAEVQVETSQPSSVETAEELSPEPRKSHESPTH